jgi:diguanylate cyclase
MGDDRISPKVDVLQAIGAFLSEQRLEPTPINYAFGYRVIADPSGELAREVALRTDGGIRLTSTEIEAIGQQVEPAPGIERRGAAASAAAPDPAPDQETRADALVTATRQQVAGFETMMQAMQTETQDFGRDLAASEDALRRTGVPRDRADGVIEELARITTAMRARVDVAEARLQQATREASELRHELAAAQDDARRDTLTGLPNRRAFEEALALADGAACHIAICDVDHFKSVNDRYGHPVGDRVLKAIAATLARECAGHLVARHGGEEFTLLLTGVDADAACALLETARVAVGKRRYRLRESDTAIDGITLSAGIVTLRPGETVTEAIQRADQYLYAAKRTGRDRMVGEFCADIV